MNEHLKSLSKTYNNAFTLNKTPLNRGTPLVYLLMIKLLYPFTPLLCGTCLNTNHFALHAADASCRVSKNPLSKALPSK